MFIDLDDEQTALRDELRSYYAALLTPELRREMDLEHGTGPVRRQVVEQLGRDGWIALGWPTEHGGAGRSAVDQFIFYDETMRAGSPAPMLTINTVGPTLMQFGSEAQKARFLPEIAAGRLHFCIGYSEPDAGTDLASLTTRAVRDGDEYVINGQKTWTSLAQGCDFIWLAARTNLDAPKHKGLSLFAIPIETPGITLEPLSLLSSHDINHTFFDDVRVPADALVGEENQGWRLITSQLNRERVTLCSSALIERAIDNAVIWAGGATRSDGVRVLDVAWVRRNLAEVTAELEYLRLLNWKVAWTVATKQLDVADSSSVKVYGTEFYTRAFRRLMQVYNELAYLQQTDPGMGSSLESLYRSLVILTFGGGTNEMQRDLITTFGMGFPRADR